MTRPVATTKGRRRKLHVVVVNLDKDKGRDRRYIWLVLRAMLRLRGRGVVCLVETKQGGQNVRMRGVGVIVRGRRWVKVGDVGVHNDVEVARVRLGRGLEVPLVVGHGPQRKSVATGQDPSGQEAQDRYYETLTTKVLDPLGGLSIFVGDLNNQPAAVAAITDGTPFGAPGDVMGGVVRGLRVVDQWATRIGKDRDFTGHLEAWATLTIDT